MNEVLLSDSEKEILEWMWKEDKEYSYRDVAAQFGEDSEKGWKKQTLSTFLTRMEQKGVISVRCEGEERFKKRRYFKSLNGQKMVDGNEGEKLKKIICVDGKIQVL